MIGRPDLSAQPCGCDPGAKWICEEHRCPHCGGTGYGWMAAGDVVVQCQQCKGTGKRTDPGPGQPPPSAPASPPLRAAVRTDPDDLFGKLLDAGRVYLHADRFVDDLVLHYDPSRRAHRLVVIREYVKARETLDIHGDEPWVRLRRALRGMKL